MRPERGRDDGYTLAECLVAMAVIGLAMAGLSAGVMTLARQQGGAIHRSADDRDRRAAGEGLARFLDGQGPFIGPGPASFEGAPSSFHFPCGEGDDCRAWLTLAGGGVEVHFAGPLETKTFVMKGMESAQFVYTGSKTTGPEWPADGFTPQPLKSISIVAKGAGHGALLTTAPVWLDQSPNCDFDAILRDCRR